MLPLQFYCSVLAIAFNAAEIYKYYTVNNDTYNRDDLIRTLVKVLIVVHS